MTIPILHGEKELKRNEGIYTTTHSRSGPETAVGTQVSYAQFSFYSDCSAAQPARCLVIRLPKQLQGNSSHKGGSKDL